MKEEYFRNNKITEVTSQCDDAVSTPKRVAFYQPISEISPFNDSTLLVEKRSQSTEEDRKSSDGDGRKSPDSFAYSRSSHQSYYSEPTLRRNMHDFDDDDEDNYSVASAYTYGTVDTAATSESVQSIIDRLKSESARRRKRLMRRRAGRTGVVPPVSPSDPLKGLAVEIRE